MANAKMDIEEKKCLTPEFRVSFAHVFKAKAFTQGQEPKYSVRMLFPKTTDLKELKRAALNAAKEKWGPKDEWPEGIRFPFLPGDKGKHSKYEGYKGSIVVGASSKQRPGIVDQKRAQIVEEDDKFYSGCYARATLIAFAYETGSNIGVSFALQNLQKLRDGERFSGKKRAEDEFEEVADESDDATSYGSGSGEDDDDIDF